VNTLLYKSARFRLRMTPEAVEPGAIGTIIEVEQISHLTDLGPKVRIRVGNYESPWILPEQLEIWKDGDGGHEGRAA
jgi:hypothetical protein